jgi:glycosyltransferase involved in cell wall biosynthesis
MADTKGSYMFAPRVSVIIPSYSTAGLIARCLDSVFAQTYNNFEVIVVNDGSPDANELEYSLNPYLPRIVYAKQANKGAAGARNTAIRQARGEFLAFLDSDDEWYPDHLSRQMEIFDASSGVDLIYSNSLIVTQAGEWPFMDACPSRGEATFEALVVERCQIPVSTVVARKSAIVRAGCFDENLRQCDDYDMWLRTAFYGGKIAYTETVQARLAGSRPGSLGLSHVRMLKACWDILEKISRTLPLSNSQVSLVRNRAEKIKALYFWEQGKLHMFERQFDKARDYISGANELLRIPKLTMVLLGLRLAPKTTRNLALYLAGH